MTPFSRSFQFPYFKKYAKMSFPRAHLIISLVNEGIFAHRRKDFRAEAYADYVLSSRTLDGWVDHDCIVTGPAIFTHVTPDKKVVGILIHTPHKAVAFYRFIEPFLSNGGDIFVDFDLEPDKGARIKARSR